MANIASVRRKPIQIELDKVRNIKFTLDAFAELEDKYGTVEEAFDALQKGKFRDIIFFLAAGLVHEDESLTAKVVGKLIDYRDLPVIMQSVNEALSQDSPGTAPGEEETASPN